MSDLVIQEVKKLQAQLAECQRERDEARIVLAYTDLGSLPNDWSLLQIIEARLSDMLVLRDQVRDTCIRAEKAEADRDCLRAAIESAPHDEACKGAWLAGKRRHLGQQFGFACNCWKREALLIMLEKELAE